MGFVVSRTKNAYAVPMFLQPMLDLTIDCMWCGRKGIHPVSKAQRTCGRQGCGEKHGKYAEQIRKALRSGRASVWVA